jgi:hypothetical protein
MKSEAQIREMLADAQKEKDRLREELPKWHDIWVGTTDDYEKAVHARHQYEETMGSIVWFNAVIGAFTAVLEDQ